MASTALIPVPDEIWYRFEDKLYAAPVNEDGDMGGPPRVDVTLFKYRVVKHTPKGVWLSLYFDDRLFVLKSATRRFACPTLHEALVSFMARKKKQARILRRRAAYADEAVAIARRKFATELDQATKQKLNELIFNLPPTPH